MGNTVLFCSAPAEHVDRSLKAASNSNISGEIIYIGPVESTFSIKPELNYIKWGDGHFSLRKAISLFPTLRNKAPQTVIIPLNNKNGFGYGSIRLFARLLSSNVIEVDPDGTTRKVNENILTLLLEPELNFHRIFLALLKPFSNRIIKNLKNKMKPDAIAGSKPALKHTVIQEQEEKTVDVSVVIRTNNEEQFLEKTIEMALAQTSVKKEIIVIDSESTDNTIEIAKRFPVRIFSIKKEAFSYGGTLNLGAKLSNGKIIANLSAHAMPKDKNWLSNLIEPLTDSNIAGVHGKELPIEGKAGFLERKVLADLYGNLATTSSENIFFSNANSATRKETLTKFPFDESLDWAEDQIWAKKVHKAGYKTAYRPDASVFHSHNLSATEFAIRHLRFYRVFLKNVNSASPSLMTRDYERSLPYRTLSFRRFLADKSLMGLIPALFYAPYCEFLNYLGCLAALQEHNMEGTNGYQGATALHRESIANMFISGHGIEIGALNNPLTVSKNTKVKYVDRLPANQLQIHYPKIPPKDFVKIDIIDNGELLESIDSSSLDFVIANHFLEHCKNPIGAIENMLRVLKDKGTLYLAVPDKRFTFDKKRPTTTIAHLMRDYTEGPDWAREEEFEEYIKNFLDDSEDIKKGVDYYLSIDYSIHYHVWTQAEILEILLTLKRELGFKFEVELFLSIGNEILIILRKSETTV